MHELQGLEWHHDLLKRGEKLDNRSTVDHLNPQVLQKSLYYLYMFPEPLVQVLLRLNKML